LKASSLPQPPQPPVEYARHALRAGTNQCDPGAGRKNMDWQKLLSTKRLGAEDSDSQPRPGRTEFESDIDRIVFCSAFRRLGKKTQVHPLAPNDHVHTRLTHSLEVSRVGKALGKELGNQFRQSGDKYIPNETLPWPNVPEGQDAFEVGTIPRGLPTSICSECSRGDNKSFVCSSDHCSTEITHHAGPHRPLPPLALKEDME
jgi:hypothetical protein